MISFPQGRRAVGHRPIGASTTDVAQADVAVRDPADDCAVQVDVGAIGRRSVAQSSSHCCFRGAGDGRGRPLRRSRRSGHSLQPGRSLAGSESLVRRSVLPITPGPPRGKSRYGSHYRRPPRGESRSGSLLMSAGRRRLRVLSADGPAHLISPAAAAGCARARGPCLSVEAAGAAAVSRSAASPGGRRGGSGRRRARGRGRGFMFLLS